MKFSMELWYVLFLLTILGVTMEREDCHFINVTN